MRCTAYQNFRVLGKTLLRRNSLKATVSKTRYSSQWNNYVLTFIQNILNIKREKPIKTRNYRQLISSHLLDISAASGKDDILPSILNKLKPRKSLSGTRILNRRWSSGRILKNNHRPQNSSIPNINPIIAGYKVNQSRSKLSKQCNPYKRTPYWREWLKWMLGYFPTFRKPQVRYYRLKKNSNHYLQKSWHYMQKYYRTKETKSNIKSNTTDGVECAGMPDVFKTQRKVLCKKIFKGRPYKTSSSSLACLQKKTPKIKPCTKDIDISSVNQENSLDRLSSKGPQPESRPQMIDAFYFFAYQRKSTIKPDGCIPPGRKSKASYSNTNIKCNTVKTKTKCAPKNLSKDDMNLEMKLMKCEKLEEQNKTQNRCKDFYKPRYTLKRIREAAKEDPNRDIDECDKAKKWQLEFDNNELLTCKRIVTERNSEAVKNSCQPCVSMPELNIHESQQSECESEQQSNHDVSRKKRRGVCNRYKKQENCEKIPSHNNEFVVPDPPVFKYKIKPECFKTSLIVSPGERISCTSNNKNVIVQNVEMHKGSQNQPDTILLRIRIRIPLSMLKLKRKPKSIELNQFNSKDNNL